MSGAQEVIFTTRKHPCVLTLPIVVLFVLAAAVGFALAYIPLYWRPQGIYLVVALAVLVLIIGVVRPVLAWAGRTVTLTTGGIILRSGWLRRRCTELAWNRVDEVSMIRHPIGRLLGCGTLHLVTVSGRDIRLSSIGLIRHVYQAVGELVADQQVHHPRESDPEWPDTARSYPDWSDPDEEE